MPGEKLIQTVNIWLSCTKYVISAGLLWWISLVHRRGLSSANISASVEKSENLNMESWLVPLIPGDGLVRDPGNGSGREQASFLSVP